MPIPIFAKISGERPMVYNNSDYNTFLQKKLMYEEKHIDVIVVMYLTDESGDTTKVKIKFPWRLDFDGDHQGGAFSPDGRLLTSASGKHLLIFDSSSGKQLASYSGHKDVITHITYSSDGQYIGTASADKTVCVWKSPEKTQEPPTSPAKNTPTTMAIAKLLSKGKKTPQNNPKIRLSPRIDEDSPALENGSKSQNNLPLLGTLQPKSNTVNARPRSPSQNDRKNSIGNKQSQKRTESATDRSRTPSVRSLSPLLNRSRSPSLRSMSPVLNRSRSPSLRVMSPSLSRSRSPSPRPPKLAYSRNGNLDTADYNTKESSRRVDFK